MTESWLAERVGAENCMKCGRKISHQTALYKLQTMKELEESARFSDHTCAYVLRYACIDHFDIDEIANAILAKEGISL